MGDIAAHLTELTKPTPPRVLLFDLERLPGRYEADIWEPRDLKRIDYLHPDRWAEHPALLCGSWLWYGNARPGFVAE